MARVTAPASSTPASVTPTDTTGPTGSGTAGPPAAAPGDADWPLANLPARTPNRRWSPGETAPPPPGREVLNIPQCAQASEPFQSLVMTLRIYCPGGSGYQLEVHNFGSPDFVPNAEQPQYPTRVGAGRETLPLTESQLAALGLAITATG